CSTRNILDETRPGRSRGPSRQSESGQTSSVYRSTNISSAPDEVPGGRAPTTAWMHIMDENWVLEPFELKEIWGRHPEFLDGLLPAHEITQGIPGCVPTFPSVQKPHYRKSENIGIRSGRLAASSNPPQMECDENRF